ncbi:hypothetical protein C7T94_17040 [Pedobacter yulinensis]|uniref:DUF479 domain-containing protein n=1 Tax=Pedobacter yulinensis TaxID=2126353 RepID=A0A2T3HHM6_9SPHI|nr:ACP phosphodiesterase [Pedobacter yulinensis]PST81903.1 hypothetical protein C7T94_17040 [Pedobacter yulinensis]
MNFLSHFFFDRTFDEPYRAMGTVLPDLLKNASKSANLHPEKIPEFFVANEEAALLTGWLRHLAVDRYFHASSFFVQKTAELKLVLMPATEDGPVRPSFLAHIALELLLDHLLITEGMINVQQFYTQLERSVADPLYVFLEKSGFKEPEVFSSFMRNFLSSRYLLSYQKIENITYALNRICMRLWIQPFTDARLALLDEQLDRYAAVLKTDFRDIFEQTAAHLALVLPEKS